MCIHIYIDIYTYTYVYIHLSLSLSHSTYLHIYIYIYIYYTRSSSATRASRRGDQQINKQPKKRKKPLDRTIHTTYNNKDIHHNIQS